VIKYLFIQISYVDIAYLFILEWKGVKSINLMKNDDIISITSSISDRGFPVARVWGRELNFPFRNSGSDPSLSFYSAKNSRYCSCSSCGVQLERSTSRVEDVIVGGTSLAAPSGEYCWVVDCGDDEDDDAEAVDSVMVWTDLKSSCTTRGGVTSRGGVNRTSCNKINKAKVLSSAIGVARIFSGGRGALFFLEKVDDLF